jgi:hypothetical protein
MRNESIRTDARDLGLTVFENARIWLPQLMLSRLQSGENTVAGRTFNNCLLYGPAVLLALARVELDSCILGETGGDVRNLVLRPASPTSVIGAIPFQDCRFFECDFDAVGFTGSPAFVQSILDLPGGDAP